MEVELSPSNFTEKLEVVHNGSEENNFPTKLEQAIKQIIEKEGFINYKVDKRCISTNGGNYLGTLYEVDIKGTTKNGDKELNIFGKNIANPEDVKVLDLADVYNTEIFAYKELSKIFEELQEEANVPIVERYKMTKLYEESDATILIMENLTKKGFITYDRLHLMNFDFIEIAVKHLAKYHGLSFVLKEKRPEYFDKKIKSFKDNMVYDEMKGMFKSISSSVVNIVDEEYKNKIQKVSETIIDRLKEYYSDKSIKACLGHGDYRPNNIMTRIVEGEIQEIIPVDYQLLQYTTPVFDFIYLLTTSTNREFRKTHATYLKDLYYETLTNFLAYFDLDVNSVYPREDFEKVYKEKQDYALMVVLTFMPFILASEDHLPDISKDMSETRFYFADCYKERLHDVIRDMEELGFM